MKKIVSVLFVLSMILGMFSVSGISFAATYRLGDINGDGSITSDDARYMLYQIVNNYSMTTAQQTAGDMDSSGEINSTDVRILLELLLGGSVDTGTTAAAQIDLLAPTADDWYNPVETIFGSVAAVNETALSGGGYTFTNIGGMWPYAAYVYDSKLLIPSTAVIEYDLTVNCDSISINLYTGGSLPTIDDPYSPSMVKLNSHISSTNIDSGSGDLKKGSYSGTISAASLAVDSSSIENGMIALSGIKIYVVGADYSTLTIRKLTVKAYEEAADFDTATNAYELIRTNLVNSSETTGFPTLTALELYQNGSRTTASSMTSGADNKKIYHSNLKQRVVNYADGYRIDLPYGFVPDYTLSELRSRYSTDYTVMTVSKEEESPYGNTASGWNTYLTEWLNRYIASEEYLNANNISKMREAQESTSIISGYTVMTYDFMINNSDNLKYPYYSIAIIRSTYVYNEFYLIVLKSAVPTSQLLDAVLNSFATVTASGTPVNTQGQYQQVIPANWSAETKAYYEKLCSQTTTDFGFFTHSMVASNDGSYNSQYDLIQTNYDRLSTAMNYDYAIMPTYTHLKWYSTYNDFPLAMANEFAGGNGFNGKPVLQFTYQFTTNNNSNLYTETAMFDILRGIHDDQFRKLAQDIKSYGKPILFRLNNEMNTDWTSYCGMATLLDPDVFIMTWQRLYDIFEEEGVNNCIWIFNPFDVSYPYGSWNEDVCYMPGVNYVQVIGLTGYVNGNSTELTEKGFESFESVYTDLYEKNQKHYLNYPWIISEFGCGAGGSSSGTLGRYASQQANWVTQMFNDLNNKSSNAYCANIKGAVWFSANDYASDGKINNYFALDSTLTGTLQAFKNGLSNN